MSKAIKATAGSENIFADLGFANPEEELAESEADPRASGDYQTS